MQPPPPPMRGLDDRAGYRLGGPDHGARRQPSPPRPAMQPPMHPAGGMHDPLRGPYRLGPDLAGDRMQHHPQQRPRSPPPPPMRGIMHQPPPPLREQQLAPGGGPGWDRFGPAQGPFRQGLGPGERFGGQEADPFRDPLPPPRQPVDVMQPRAPYRMWGKEQPPPPHMGMQQPPPPMQQYGDRMHQRGVPPVGDVGHLGPPMQQPGPRGLPHAPYRAMPGELGPPGMAGRGPFRHM